MNGRLKPNWYNARKVLRLFFGKRTWNHRCWRQRPIADDWLSQIMEKSKKITVNYRGIFFIICWPKFFFIQKIGVVEFFKADCPYVAQWQITDEKLSWKSSFATTTPPHCYSKLHVAPKGLKLIIVHCDLIYTVGGIRCVDTNMSAKVPPGNTLKFGLLMIIRTHWDPY